MSSILSASSQHEVADLAQVHSPRLHVVDETAGSSHDHLEAVFQRFDLGAVTHASEDGLAADARAFRKRRRVVRDLLGELSCRAQREHL